MGRRLAVAPDAFLERSGEIGAMGLAHEVRALVVECRVQEELLVVELEVLLGLADAALTQGQELLALSKRPHSYGPFFESNRHGISFETTGFTLQTPSRVTESTAATGKARDST